MAFVPDRASSVPRWANATPAGAKAILPGDKLIPRRAKVHQARANAVPRRAISAQSGMDLAPHHPEIGERLQAAYFQIAISSSLLRRMSGTSQPDAG
jgi:hypothetical protein